MLKNMLRSDKMPFPNNGKRGYSRNNLHNLDENNHTAQDPKQICSDKYLEPPS